ncbi:MAG: hypothetical protein IJO20_01415 [Ruminococcus sp.]|nr:hypothetical protein [Ruminococcus sp.]
MNDFNFDRMKSFNTPTEWAEKAREIPEKYKNPTPFLFFPVSRSFAAVASLVLVCSLSVLFFIFKPDDNILPVNPDATLSYETVSKTESVEPMDPTYDTGKPQNPDEYVNIEPTESRQSTENPTTVSPTQKPTSSTEYTEPTQKPTNSAPTTEPTQKPTDSKPTSKPTEKPTQKPTNDPSQNPTAGTTSNPVICRGSYSFSNSWEVNSVDVFCKLYDSSGNLMGDKDLYSYQHEASIDSMSISMVYVSYEPTSKGLLLPKGQYSFYFYDYFGRILSHGYVTVS